jgi:hypothetical protein
MILPRFTAFMPDTRLNPAARGVVRPVAPLMSRMGTVLFLGLQVLNAASPGGAHLLSPNTPEVSGVLAVTRSL